MDNQQYCLECGTPLDQDKRCPKCGKIYGWGQTEGVQGFSSADTETFSSISQYADINGNPGSFSGGRQESAAVDQNAWNAWMEQNMHLGKKLKGAHSPFPSSDSVSTPGHVPGGPSISDPVPEKESSVYTILAIVLSVVIIVQLVVLVVLQVRKSGQSSAQAMPVCWLVKAEVLTEEEAEGEEAFDQMYLLRS